MTGRQNEKTSINAVLGRSAESGNSGFFFDFDGVLAPIELDPDSVAPVPGVIDQLADLAPLVRKIVIISARPVNFLVRHFGGLTAISLYGLYGLESVIDGRTSVNLAAESWVEVVQSVKRDADNELPAGVYVEDKRLSVSLHFRQHPEFREQVEHWAAARARRLGLIEQQGRMVVELKPPVSIDKGTVLGAEVDDLRCAWYFGDDISDAKGFQVLRDKHRRDPGFIAVCVAVSNPETGQSLEEQADFTLRGPEALPELLASAVTAYRAGASPG